MESARVQKEANEKFANLCLKFLDLLREYRTNPKTDTQILENSSMIAKVTADALNAQGYSAHYFQ